VAVRRVQRHASGACGGAPRARRGPVSLTILPGHRGAHAGRYDAYQGYGPQRAAVWRGVRNPLSAPLERAHGVIAGRSNVVHWPRGSRTSPPRRSRRACGQHGKRDPEPRGCREPPRMDGRATPYPLWRIGHPQNPPLHPSGCWAEGLLSTAIVRRVRESTCTRRRLHRQVHIAPDRRQADRRSLEKSHVRACVH
jgi:hypothetical protein